MATDYEAASEIREAINELSRSLNEGIGLLNAVLSTIHEEVRSQTQVYLRILTFWQQAEERNARYEARAKQNEMLERDREELANKLLEAYEGNRNLEKRVANLEGVVAMAIKGAGAGE